LLIEAIYIETSSKCNLSCSYCYRTRYSYASKNRHLSLRLFSKLINDLSCKKNALFGKDAPVMYLHGFGEPTLNPDLGRMIQAATDSHLFSNIRFVSNLQAIKPSGYYQYFETGLDLLYVSMDTVTQVDHKLKRKGTKSNNLLSVLSKIAIKYSNRLSIITVLSDQNISELTAIGELLSQLKISKWNIQLLNTGNGDFAIDAHLVTLLKKDLKKLFKDIDISFEEESLFACKQPFNTLVINSMGYFVPCCSMTNHEVKNFGNLLSEDVAQVWHGRRYLIFRKNFKAKRPAICKKCPYYGINHIE